MLKYSIFTEYKRKINMRTFNALIEEIIKERLKLQYIQRTLENKFGISESKFDKITNPSFLKKFNSWEPEKKKDFIYTIAGKVNIARTFKLFEELKDKYEIKT